MTLIAWLLLIHVATQGPTGPPRSLASVAEAAKVALQRGDFDALIPSGARVQVQLPDVNPATPLGPGQAGATLRTTLRRGETDRVRVVGYREVGEDRGYVDLVREYRGPGSGDRRGQRVLLGYRRSGTGWVLEEVLVN